MRLLSGPFAPTALHGIVVLGVASLLPYLLALRVGDLRGQLVAFELCFFAAFALYLAAVLLVLRQAGAASRRQLVLIVGFGLAFRALLVPSIPTLTDDMYRYVWDGRVQAAGLNPYAYPPAAAEVADLRDDAIWPSINRKWAVTVYPGGAQLAFAALWRAWPDNVHWFQAAMAGGDFAAGLLLIPLLRAFGLPPQRALVYLWSPLAVFETAHAAHVDGLVLPFLVAALLARARGRSALCGALLGAAASLKLYSGLLLPILWRPRVEAGRPREWSFPLAFAATFAATYLPYLGLAGGVIGFLPIYFTERFNPSLGYLVTELALLAGLAPERAATGLLLAALALLGIIFLSRPAESDAAAVRRCIWPIGAFTLLAQVLYPWYLLWLLPLVALFVRSGRRGLRADAWTGWLLFSGLATLSYIWFIAMSGPAWTFLAQYVPLYALLALSALGRRGRSRVLGVILRPAGTITGPPTTGSSRVAPPGQKLSRSSSWRA